MKDQTAIIDERAIAIQPGDTVLQAARRAGVDIPTLCYHHDLAPEGGCRICLVETDRRGRLQAACHTPLQPGMEIRTSSARIDSLRRDILSLYLSANPADLFHASSTGTETERLMHRLGVTGPAFGHAEEHAPGDESHPYLRFYRSLCINCRRCLHACEEIQGQFVYGLENRGFSTRLIFGPSERFADSPCVACGACVDHCPTGAITDADRIGARSPEKVVRSTCGYCGVGCQLDIETSGNRVLRIHGTSLAEVNHGHLCVKGRYAHAHQHSADRLTQPLLRTGERWQEIGWPEAVSWLSTRLLEICRRSGPSSLGAFTSSRSTNEAAYLLQKLFRTILRTNNVDCCARVCHSSTALALQTVTGTGAATASYADLPLARSIVLAGANATEGHPVVGARIKQAVLAGASLIVIDPRRIELAEYADLHLQLKPGTNVPLFNAIAKILLEQGLIDRSYVESRTEGFAEFSEFLKALSLAEVARITGVAEEQIGAAAMLLGRNGPGMFISGLGLSELTQGTASVIALCNLGMLTGSIGKKGAGMLPLRGQNNVQGNADMGGMPDQVTGYQAVSNPEVRSRVGKIWGVEPPSERGLTISEMLDAAAQKQIKALWMQGEDVAQSDPNQSHVLEALEALELLVVQEMFFSETARFAHLVLPAAGALEQEGTFTNGERRIQLVRPAVPAPGEARADWEAIRDVANAMGAGWRYQSPAEIMDEIAQVAPALFGGVSYARLEPDGLQWPCPSPRHPGTSTVHSQGFLRGKGRLVGIDFVPSPEHSQNGFPFLLITGRALEHYNVGTMTRRTPNRELLPCDFLEIHSADAQRWSIEDGRPVEVKSRWGRTKVNARISDRVPPGVLFLTFHFPETHANLLTSPYVDPQSKCPEYKVTAVAVTPLKEEVSLSNA
jgi:formate dehydrogenase major subunit